MRPVKNIFFLLALAFMTCNLHAQIAMGTWRLHVATGKAIDVANSDQYIFTAYENGVLRYNFTTKEKKIYTSVQGLSDIQISTILFDKKLSGWTKDKISNGITKATKNQKGEYDIIFVDVTKNIISSREDGGEVLLLNKGKSSFSLLVVYPGKTAEIYSFIKNNSGLLEYIHITSRAGDLISTVKSTVMQGECSFIDFSKI